MRKTASKKAFSIIEAIIVLCATTIIIGGLFFAKKITLENNVKSLVMQIKKYDAAINNFTQKYHGLPGDIKDTETYGITSNNTDGNGDNVISDLNGHLLSANGELTKFWLHLSTSKMLDENYDGKDDEDAKTGSTFPASRIGDKIGIVAFGAEGKTFYQIGFGFADSDRIYMNDRSLKADEAFLFDQKIDDGNPKKGVVVATGGESLNTTKNNECVKFDAYNKGAISPICQLRIEISSQN